MHTHQNDPLAITAERILLSNASSRWLQGALASALHRDPVDAVNDAELLLCVLSGRLETAMEAAS